jgi:Ca2+-binding RTX toxin-like protein
MLTDLVTKANAGSTTQELADSLAANAAFTSQFPVWMTAAEFTSKIVSNMFAGGTVSKADTDAAVDYIAGAITAGTFTKTSAVVALTSYMASAAGVANATYGSVSQAYQNKVEVAEYYTITKGLGDASAADRQAAIAGITSEALTVTSEKSAIDTAADVAAVVPATGFTLTTGLDSGAKFTGGAGADNFAGTMTFSGNALTAAATMTAGDTLVGGKGEDKLEITVTGAAVTDAGETITPVLDGIEIVHVRSFETDASGNTGATTNFGQDSVTVDLSNATGVTNVGTSSTNNVEADVAFTNLGSAASMTMSGKGDLSVAHTATVTAGAATAVTLNLNDVGTSAGTPSAIATSGIELLTIASGGGSNFLALEDDAYTSVTVTGDQALTLDVADAGVLAFDASAATGKVTADLSTGTTANFTSIVGGAGTTDVITLGGATIDVNLLTSSLGKISGFETLKVDTAHNITLSADSAGISAFDLTGGSNAAQVLTLNDGYTSDTTVTIESTNDSVVNNANVGLTVSMGGASLATGGTALTGGTGTDNLVVIHDTNTTTIDATVTKFETMTLSTSPLAPTAAILLTTDDANIAAGKSLTVTAIGTDALAAVTFDASNETNGTLTYVGNAAVDTITGGALGDTISGNGGKDVIDGGAGDDTLNGGDADDTITIGTGSDTVDGGAGKDKIIAAANLTAADTIDGGDGTDTLQVTAVNAAALGGVTNVENLQIMGGATVTLASDLPFTTIDLSDAGTTESLTLAKGYTSETTIKMENGDTVVNTAADAVINVTAFTAHFATGLGTVLTGSDKAGVTNTLTLSNASSATVDLVGTATNIDKLTISDFAVTSGNDVGLTMTSYASAITIDSSTLDKGENLTMAGASAGAITFTGGNGTDTIVMSSAATGDSITTGTGTNTITAGTNISYLDTIVGNGKVTLGATALVDVDLQNVTGVATVNSTTGATLGSFSDAAGVTTVVALDNGAVDATTRTNGLTVTTFSAQTDTWTGGSGNDIFGFNSAGTAVAADTLVGGLGVNTISIANELSADAGTVGEATSATLDAISLIQSVVISDGATDNALGDVTLTIANTSYDQKAMTVDASALDAGEVFTFSANGVSQTDEAFTVTGGGAADIMTGGAGGDTISGGAGADTIDGNTGGDTLTGGSGSDTFVYVSGDSTSVKTDTITDFTTTVDQLQFTLTAAAGTVTFTDQGDATSIADGLALLGGVQGQYFFDKTNGKLAIDVDGNGLIQATDTIVNLTGLDAFSSVDLDVVLTAVDTAGTLTTGSGNDRFTTVVGDKVNVLVGGAGNDTYLMIDPGEADVLVEGASGGTDTLVTGAALDIAGYKFGTTAAGATANGALTNFEQLVLKEGATFTADATNFNGVTVAINNVAAGTLTIAAPGSTVAAQTMNFGGITVGAVSYLDANGDAATGVALDANDILNITGGSGIDNVTTAPTIINNINTGVGADVITLGTGTDVITIDGGLTIDTITGFDTTSGDQILLDVSVLVAAGKVAAGVTSVLGEIFDNNDVANPSGTPTATGVQILTGAGAALDAKNLFVLDLGATKFLNAAAVTTALEALGAAALTFAGNVAADDSFVVAYENTTGGTTIATMNFAAGDNNSGGAAPTGANNLEGTDIVTLAGVADASLLTATEILLV